VYSNYAAKCFTVSGSNPKGGIFFSILNYVCDIVVKRFTFAISHLLMSACISFSFMTGHFCMCVSGRKRIIFHFNSWLSFQRLYRLLRVFVSLAPDEIETQILCDFSLILV